jgi:hypothetical protein
MLSWLQFDSAAIWYGGQVWRLFICVRPCAIGAAVVRDRDVAAICVWAGSGTLCWAALLHCAVSDFADHPCDAAYNLGLWQRSVLVGSPALHFGIFVAFATIYPQQVISGSGKVGRLILAAVYTFQLLAYHAWNDLVVVWTSIGAAFLSSNGVARTELAWWNALKTRFAPKPKYRVVHRTPPPRGIR